MQGATARCSRVNFKVRPNIQTYIFSESCVRVCSVYGAGTAWDPVFLVYEGYSCVLNLCESALLACLSRAHEGVLHARRTKRVEYVSSTACESVDPI